MSLFRCGIRSNPSERLSSCVMCRRKREGKSKVKRQKSKVKSVFALAVLSVCGLLAQATHPATGREIAPVMGMGGADWLVRAEREREEAPERALDAIGLAKGDVVADIGAGVGYCALRMAGPAGPAGQVFSSDFDSRRLEVLRENVVA